jgi:hypothetical protein
LNTKHSEHVQGFPVVGLLGTTDPWTPGVYSFIDPIILYSNYRVNPERI